MEPIDSNNKTNSSRAWVYIIVIIVAILVVWWLVSLGGTGSNQEEVTEIAPGENLRTAKEGELISGFPEYLILEDGVVTDESYSIEYENQNLDQPVASFVSNWSLEQNIEAYRLFFNENEWEVDHQADASEGDVTFFYARSMNMDANVTFQKMEDDSVRVVIAVVNKEDSTMQDSSAQ